MKPMNLLSSRKSSSSSSSSGSSRPSSSAAHHQQPPPPKPNQSQSVDSSAAAELLHLRLENSDLRTRLDDALSHTDESKSELLHLLEEQTSQSNLLQHKCDELHRGFVKIDKERRALRKSADDARKEARKQVEQTRGECERRCSQLERHLKVREKEVETLAERTREQERRIEVVAGDYNERQSKVDDLEGELEKLIGMVENERAAMSALKEEYGKVMEAMRVNVGELEVRKVAEKNLELQLKETRQTLQDERDRWKLKEEQLTKELLEKEAEVANLLQDQQLSKIEHEQAVQTFQDEMEKQRKDFSSKHKQMTESHQHDKAAIIDTLQSQIDAKSSTAENLTSEIETLQSNHATKVSGMENFIQTCEESTQAIEKTYQESLEINSQLQKEMNSLGSSNQIEQEELKAANYLLEKENDELVEALDSTKLKLSSTNENLSSVQAECTMFQQELDGTKGQLVDTSGKITAFLAEHETLQEDYAALQQGNLELTKELDGTKMQLVDTNELLGGVRTECATLQLDLDGTTGQLAETSEKLSGISIEQEELKAANYLLKKENDGLAEELDGTKVRLADTAEKLGGFRNECKTVLQKHTLLEQELVVTNGRLADTSEKQNAVQAEHTTLQSEYDSLQHGHSQLERQISTLEGHMEQTAVDHEDELSQKSQKISDMMNELNEEKSMRNKLRSQFRELNIQLKESGTARQKKVRTLERELEGIREDLSMKENEANDLNAELQAELTHHTTEIESLRTEHAAQTVVLETRGADVVTNLENAIAGLEKEVAQRELEHEGILSKMQHEKQYGVARQKELRTFERELGSVREDLLKKENEANDLNARLQADATRHATTMKSLQTEHAAQMVVIETRGADVVSDLENVITELEKEFAVSKAEHKHMQQESQTAIANVNLEKERLAEQRREGMEQQQKIALLTAYAKERKEKVKMMRTELESAKHTLENSEDAVSTIQNELQDACALHEQETSHLQHTVDDVRSELSVVKERLNSEDGELKRAKATLSERTNLLRDMVNQTTTYQSDYEREHTRANQLDEAMKSYKKQLAEAHDIAQHHEHEIHDKDTHYCDAIRNERRQRKVMESELESSHKSMEDVFRKSCEIEKENSTLKDKVSRQEKYIGRLQDREKQNRRVPIISTATGQGNHRGRHPKITPPSTSGVSRSPERNAKERVAKLQPAYSMDENDKPNIRRLGSARSRLPRSPDELDSLLG